MDENGRLSLVLFQYKLTGQQNADRPKFGWSHVLH